MARILYVTDFLPHAEADHAGGKLIHAYMEAMREAGNSVSLLALCSPADLDKRATVEKACASSEIIRVSRSPFRRATSFALSLVDTRPGAYCRSAGFGARAGAFLADKRFDVAHFFHPWLIDAVASSMAPSARIACRFVAHVNDVYTLVTRRRLLRFPSPANLKEYFWASHTEFRSYSLVDRLLVHTQSDADSIAAKLRRLPSVVVFPAWFDALGHPLPDIGTRHSEERFIVVGNSSDPRWRDSVRWLLGEVWPAVYSQHPTATLHLHSVRPEHRGRWLEVPGVVPHPYVGELLPVFDKARALLFPLKSGGFTRHIKILDAMARGCPVVMTSEANTAERLRDGEQALIRDDARGFVEAMCALLRDPDAYVAMTRAAQLKIRADYKDFDLTRLLTQAYSENES